MNDSTRRRLEEIVAILAGVVADLDDVSFDELQSAAEEGRGRPDVDRTITQARRAVEKARRLLEDGSA